MPPKGRRPAHQNRTAFKAQPHSTRTRAIASIPNEGLCQRCHEIIEWRKQYHKFKPLTAPRTCQMCHQKTVVHAYHVICTECARSKGVCAKCLEARDIVKPVVTPEEKAAKAAEIEEQMYGMSLRQKRSFYRELDRRGELSDSSDSSCGCEDECCKHRQEKAAKKKMEYRQQMRAKREEELARGEKDDDEEDFEEENEEIMEVDHEGEEDDEEDEEEEEVDDE